MYQETDFTDLWKAYLIPLYLKGEKVMNWLLTAFAESAPAAGTATTDPAAQGNQLLVFLVQFGPIVLLFGLMYVILIMPQRKREKKTRQMIDAAIVGDKVTTIGGISGKIVNIKDDEITIETGIERTKVTVKKWAIKEVDKPISE
jgi:preprotein translocase subunit YajC